MTINKQALREAAEKANPEQYGYYLVDAFTEMATPNTVLALLDELEVSQKLIAELEALTAGMEQEPVLVVGDDGGDALAYRRLIQNFPAGTKLYAAPQLPQPAVVITNEEIDSIVIPINPDGLDEEKYPIEWLLHHDRERIRKALHEYACRAAMLQGAEPVQEWIPCSERMPENSDAVLVCQEGGITFCAEYDGGEFYPDEFPNVPKQGRQITHWMPLPAAPQQEVK